MAIDPRDELWDAAFETWYLAAYNELVSQEVVRRWQIFDDTTKVLVALTASGSAVSGWALWENPNYKYIWLILAGIGAVLSIVSSALGVTSRLKDWGDLKRDFSMLEVELGTFRSKMRIDPQFDVTQFTKEWVEFRRRYGEVAQRLKSDLVASKRVSKRCQATLNEQLSAQQSKP
jgi:hypothetical protein